MSYDEAAVAWSPAWVVLWIVSCLVLFGAAFVVQPGAWSALFATLFLVPEMVGLRRHRDRLPPLTFVVRRYLPRWVPTALTFGLGAFLFVTWLPVCAHPAVVAISVASMIGWLTEHWDITYEETP